MTHGLSLSPYETTELLKKSTLQTREVAALLSVSPRTVVPEKVSVALTEPAKASAPAPVAG